MAELDHNSECSCCQALLEKVAELTAKVAQLEAELAKAKKNSRNSSKPPSSDITNPKKADKGKDKKGSDKKRKRGGQPGHPKHEREAFPESQIDFFENYTCPCCPDCGGPTDVTDGPARIIQQVEIVPSPIKITQHQSHPCWCEHCQKIHYAPIDEAAKKAGLIGPRLTALVAYLKGACHCSFSTIRKFLRDVVGVKVSRGLLRKVVNKVSESLKDPYLGLLDALPDEAVLNIDETGHKDNGKRHWTWVFRAATYAVFRISPSRSSEVLLEVLGKEFDGVIGCDYFSAYRKFMGETNAVVQFCLAHLIRDVKFLVGHPHSRTAAYGRRLQKALRNLFDIIHRRDEMDPDDFANQLEDAGALLCAQARFYVPGTAEAQNLKRRFDEHGDSYIRFITTPGVEPTNNLAEQAIRFVVIDRRITQGSRSDAGQRWLERIWTTIATCAKQGRSVFEFLCESVDAYFTGAAAPSLAFDTS